MSNHKSPPAPSATPRAVLPPRLYLYVDTIVRHGSIRRAAQILGVAPSALNRRLFDLERDLGTALFERGRHGVRPTAAGGVFAAHVRRTITDAERTAAALEALDGEIAGDVAVGAAESAAVDILPALLASLQAEAPALRFSLSVGTPASLLADLLADRADLILTHERPAHRDADVLTAPRRSFCALMRAGHPLAHRDDLRIADCCDYPYVVAEENYAARAIVDALLASSPPRDPPALTTNVFAAMSRYVRETDAVAFQFHLRAADEAARDGLVAVPLADAPVADTRLHLAVRRGRALPRRVTAVCAHIRAHLDDGARP